jgi:DNA-binding transcriptional regulator YiaG
MPIETPDDAARVARVRHMSKTGQAKAIRVGAGLSQQDVANACKVSRAAVANWEGRRRAPRSEAALAYAALLTRLAP